MNVTTDILVEITPHVVEQWSSYGFGGIDIKSAFKDARKAEDDECIPKLKGRMSGYHYYLNDDLGTCFVTLPINKMNLRILTCIRFDDKPIPKIKITTPVLKKDVPQKKDSPPKKVLPKVGVIQQQTPVNGTVKLQETPASSQKLAKDFNFKDIASLSDKEAFEEYKHLCSLVKALDSQFPNLPTKNNHKKNLVRQKIQIQNRISLIRHKVHAYRSSFDGKLFSEDGSVNVIPALKFLLDKVESLQKELEELKCTAKNVEKN